MWMFAYVSNTNDHQESNWEFYIWRTYNFCRNIHRYWFIITAYESTILGFTGKNLPERFLQGSGKHAYQYLPFSAGQRNCAAEKCIHTVIKTIIITFVERVNIKIVNKVTNANKVMNGTVHILRSHHIPYDVMHTTFGMTSHHIPYDVRHI